MKYINNFIIRYYIYKIWNTQNKKVYIGLTSNPSYRRRQYINIVKNLPPDNKRVMKIHNAMKEISIENFIFEVFEEYENFSMASQKENYWIDFYQSNTDDGGYNETGGFGIPDNIDYNLYRSRLSKRMQGSNNPMFGKKHSKETINKLISHFSGENNPFYGRRHTEESKKKIGEASKGRVAGENNPHAKLTFDIVSQIREDWSTGKYKKKQLAKKYNITPASISDIVNFKTWVVKL